MTAAEIQRVTRETLDEIVKDYPEEKLPTPGWYIKRCMVNIAGAIMQEQAKNGDEMDLRKASVRAFVLSLPPLEDKESVHAFIACIAQGLALGLISGKKASTLLYSAQVALSLLKEPKVKVKIKQKTVAKVEAVAA